MSIKSDRWIKRMALERRMIEPFSENQIRDGVISYGLSSYGYDIRVADEFKIFTNINSTIVDPKRFDQQSFVDFKGDVCIIPPNSFALARTVEYFRIPRNILTLCVGKCLTGDTRIVDAETGEYRSIRDFVSAGASTTVSLADWRLRTTDISAHLSNGVQPVYELRTRSGLQVKATITHPFRTLEGWKALAALQPGERIAAARSCPYFGKEDWPEHEAVLLGLLLADGQCRTPRHSPRYTTADSRLVQVFTDAVHGFGCEVSPVGRYGYNLVNRRGHGGVIEKNRANLWLERLGCNVRSAEKAVPAVVFRAKRDRVATFLRALFSGDGSVYRSGNGVYLEYSSTSGRLAYDVRHLLLRFGIFSLVRRKVLAGGGTAYRVQITDREMIQQFAREVGFIPGSRKAETLADVGREIARQPKRKSNFDTLPAAAWKIMRETVQASGRSLAAVGIKATPPRQSLPFSIAERASQFVANTEFSALVQADVVWDMVESITPAGEEAVFDLTIPGMHNFVANDLVVHNSTYARCGIIVNVTPFEPEWEGTATLEISNTTPLPARIYANEGIAQVVFFEADETCETSYADKKGKYQAQREITLPKI